MRWRALVSYDGTDFVGWQTQSGNGRTVQEELETCLGTILREPVRVEAAGRTDAGVHATGQVIAFNLASPLLDPERALYSLNAVLPSAISVRDLFPATSGFDPRRDARRRSYRYRIGNDQWQSPFELRTVWHVREPLAVEVMREAAKSLIGRHDFYSFQTADNIVRPSVREVFCAEVLERDGKIDILITANAFCRGMVRNLVGQLVEIGKGRRTPASLAEVLAARDRSLAAPAAPPQGLFLENVEYE